MDLFYATDFADRLENQIIPALRGGFVVLTDRYIYSPMARCIVRGGDSEWIRDVYRFVPIPHAVFYLDSGENRVSQGRVIPLWKSGKCAG